MGSKCHIVETAERGKINFITNMIYQKSNENDSRIHKHVQEGNEQRGLEPEKIYADTNYINGSALDDYRNRGQELMGYIQRNTSKKPEAFKLQRFAVNMNTFKAVCPAGEESLRGRITKKAKVIIAFSRTICKNCAFFRECVGEGTAKARTLYLTPHVSSHIV